jgi:hypothetical protein
MHSRNPSGCTLALGVGSVSNINENQGCFLGGKGGPCVWMTILPLSVCRLKVLGASPSWSPRDLSMSVEGELYLYQLQALTSDAVSLCSNWQSFRPHGFSFQHRSGYLASSFSWFYSVSSFKCRDKTFVSSHSSDHTIEWSKSSLFFSDRFW